MSQEQNNNTQKKMDTATEPELTTEEWEEIINEVEEDNYWNSCFEQLERMKTNQMKYKRLDIEKINKEFKPNGQPVDKLKLYKKAYYTSLYYYSNLSNYLRLAEMDNMDALAKYKYYQRKYREIQTYIENTEKFKKGTPSWDEYCKWQQELTKRNNKRKEEKKPKKNN